jgi:periplasmic divalent cation tolerance protein
MYTARVTQAPGAGKVTDAIVVLINTGSQGQALEIARVLVEERLAACANIISPIRSIYRWQGAVQDEAEHMMIVKTRAELFARLEARVKELHSYAVPEIIALPIVEGAKSYLDWIFESTESPRRDKK